jgi:hypothetical protein
MRKCHLVGRLIGLSVGVAAALLLLSSCAGIDPGPPALTRAEIVQLSKSGEPPAAIVDRLKKSGTVLWLSASDILSLRQEGVPNAVLDYLQAAQISEVRRQTQFEQLLYGPEMSPFSRCGGNSLSGGRFSGFFAPFC